MRADDVLSIDVDAELREVAREQLQGDWQIAAELIRFAVRRGAVEISVRRGRRGFALRGPGAVCGDGELGHAARALDASLPAAERHRSIVALERAGANALLWAAGAAGARLRVANRAGRSATVLRVRPDRPPSLEVDAADEVPGGFEVELAVPGFRPRLALAWLATACRFAPVAVSVDGRALPQGFTETLRSVSLGRPLPGGLALTRSGDAPRLWLLRHGVLAGRATVPGYPPFEAVLELGDITPDGIGADELRRAAQPALPFILDRVADLIVEAASDETTGRDEAVARRICTIGLRAIRSGLARERIAEQPLVPTAAADGEARVRLSVTALRRLVASGGGPLCSVPPRARRRRRPAGAGGPVLELDAEQHRLLVEELGARIEGPGPRSRAGAAGLGSLLPALIEGARSRAVALLGSRVLANIELIDAERRLLGRLDGAVLDDRGRPLAVHLIAGVGPIRRKGPALLLPRNNPLVVRAVRLAADEERWLYPVVLALIDGTGWPAPELRERWNALNVER